VSTIKDLSLGFIGFGHMAQLLFQGLNKAALIPRSKILFVQRDASKMKRHEEQYRITSTTLPTLLEKSQLIFLCVRPHQVEGLLEEMKRAGKLEGKWVVSLLAGVPLSFYQGRWGDAVEVVRAMPNIAAALNASMTLLAHAPSAGREFRSAVELLFGAVGRVAEIRESEMDIGSAIAGSGPGFVFRLIQAMAHTAEKRGISRAKALEMAAQAFSGAAALVLEGKDPADLLIQIATPSGMTQAGLAAMQEARVDKHFEQAIEAAALRSLSLINVENNTRN
jgi:pyrroline-5-carboxylate reductase